jgi:Ca2+-binding EF-hand superfamily protein
VTNKLCRKINLLGADIREGATVFQCTVTCHSVPVTHSFVIIAFEKIDRNGDKLISYQEFADIVKSFDVGLTQDQVYDLMRSVDSNKDGHIDYTEFVARFEGGFAIVVKDDEDRERREWLLENFRNISIALHKRYKKLSTAFASFDTNSSGKISYGEFTEALKKVRLTSSCQHTLVPR